VPDADRSLVHADARPRPTSPRAAPPGTCFDRTRRRRAHRSRTPSPPAARTEPQVAVSPTVRSITADAMGSSDTQHGCVAHLSYQGLPRGDSSGRMESGFVIDLGKARERLRGGESVRTMPTTRFPRPGARTYGSTSVRSRGEDPATAPMGVHHRHRRATQRSVSRVGESWRPMVPETKSEPFASTTTSAASSAKSSPGST